MAIGSEPLQRHFPMTHGPYEVMQAQDPWAIQGHTESCTAHGSWVSRICILQDKIHQVIKDICDINKKAKLRKTTLHNYKVNPNTSHNSGRTLLSGENHHPELDSLMSGEGPEEPSPDSSTSAEYSTSTDDTSALSSSL